MVSFYSICRFCHKQQKDNTPCPPFDRSTSRIPRRLPTPSAASTSSTRTRVARWRPKSCASTADPNCRSHSSRRYSNQDSFFTSAKQHFSTISRINLKITKLTVSRLNNAGRQRPLRRRLRRPIERRQSWRWWGRWRRRRRRRLGAGLRLRRGQRGDAGRHPAAGRARRVQAARSIPVQTDGNAASNAHQVNRLKRT